MLARLHGGVARDNGTNHCKPWQGVNSLSSPKSSSCNLKTCHWMPHRLIEDNRSSRHNQATFLRCRWIRILPVCSRSRSNTVLTNFLLAYIRDLLPFSWPWSGQGLPGSRADSGLLKLRLVTSFTGVLLVSLSFSRPRVLVRAHGIGRCSPPEEGEVNRNSGLRTPSTQMWCAQHTCTGTSWRRLDRRTAESRLVASTYLAGSA